MTVTGVLSGLASQATGVEAASISWACSFAEGAPEMRPPFPGPRSVELIRRQERFEFGARTWLEQMPVAFEGGAGVTLTDVDGNRYLDLTHGHMAAGLGHGNPEHAAAIAAQFGKLAHTRTFPTAILLELVERLAAITPEDLNLFVFYSSGTEAAEGAMRVARAVTGGHEFLSFYGDYHGRTMGAVATAQSARHTGPRPSGFTTVPAGYCRQCEFRLVRETCALHCVDFAERAMRTNSHGALAGIIIEPVTNGSGARVYPPGYLQGLREVANRNDVLLIFDEHASGLGRTGTWWAGDHEGVVPDVMFFGKYLGNGFPVTVVATREAYREILSGTQQTSTFGGQPVACAAALTTLDIIERDHLVAHAGAVGAACLAAMNGIAERHAIVGHAQGLGLLLAFEFVDASTGQPSARMAAEVYAACARRGVCVSLVGATIRVSPMLVSSAAVALRALDIVEQAVTDVEASL